MSLCWVILIRDLNFNIVIHAPVEVCPGCGGTHFSKLGGGGYTIVAADRYGCATRRSKGTCDNSSTIQRQHIESRVLGGLKDHMLSAEAVGKRQLNTARGSAASLISGLVQFQGRISLSLFMGWPLAMRSMTSAR